MPWKFSIVCASCPKARLHPRDFLEAGFWTFFEKADQSIGWLLRVTYDLAIMRQLLQGF
jgi:hypothetical protein